MGGYSEDSPSRGAKKFHLGSKQSLAQQQKLERDLKEVQAQQEEFRKIMARVQVIDGLVENMEDNTDAMAQDVEKFQDDMQKLEDQHASHHPLQKL